jgi:hypothetical protein
MESVYNFLKITLLGLILGVLIIILLQMHDSVDHIRKTAVQSAKNRNNEFKQEPLKNPENRQPANKLPNVLKHKI